MFRLTFNPDGSIATFTVTGLQDNVTVPGKGSVFRDAGRIVMTEPFFGDITFEAGSHDYFRFLQGETSLAQGLCEALAA